MEALNPFNVSINEMGALTPRRKQYIENRNIALEQRVESIVESVLQYNKVLSEVRERYLNSGLEDQCMIKPYLATLYFELGQLLETQEQLPDALRYYEQAGIYGHRISIKNALRLGSKLSFDYADEVFEQQQNTLEAEQAFHKCMLLVTSECNKGSAALALDDTLGPVLVTEDHVAMLDSIVHLGGQGVHLDSLESYECGLGRMFRLGDEWAAHFNGAPRVLWNAPVKLGEKVYFGGFPFRKTEAHLHKGRISSIGEDGRISIDGVAVSGMSGGPIAVKRKGELCIIGTIASETFDPIEGFSQALARMYSDQSDMQIRQDYLYDFQRTELEEIKRNPQFTKIPKSSFCIGDLNYLLEEDPDFFGNVWSDLNAQGVILDDGEVVSEKIIPGQLGLRSAYQQYEKFVLARLRAAIAVHSMSPSQINLPFDVERPTDSVNTVGLSLVQSLSTGLITGHLFQNVSEMGTDFEGEESSEFEIGRRNRVEKLKKKNKKAAQQARMEAKKSGHFQNNGLPALLYRFVSTEDAKKIKRNGIIHTGGDSDEIPFVTEPKAGIALSVGAVTTDKMITIFTDRLDHLTLDNVRLVQERNGVVTYRINTRIPPDALSISEVI